MSDTFNPDAIFLRQRGWRVAPDNSVAYNLKDDAFYTLDVAVVMERHEETKKRRADVEELERCAQNPNTNGAIARTLLHILSRMEQLEQPVWGDRKGQVTPGGVFVENKPAERKCGGVENE